MVKIKMIKYISSINFFYKVDCSEKRKKTYADYSLEYNYKELGIDQNTDLSTDSFPIVKRIFNDF